MITQNGHIAGLLTLLISLSLAFSPLHNHETLNPNSGDQGFEVSHTLDSDSSLCPICGYLFQADFSTYTTVDAVIQEYVALRLYSDQIKVHTFVSHNQERAPPYQV